MLQNKKRIFGIFLTAVVFPGLFVLGLYRLEFDMDITKSLPQSDPVLRDAGQVLLKHPVQDRIVIDISHGQASMDELVEAAQSVEESLAKSGLFKEVGMKETGKLMPELIMLVTKNLPVLFSETELEEKVAPLLTEERITETFARNIDQLLNLEGIGQAGFISLDPLGIKNLVLERLAHLAPTTEAQFYRDHLFSTDGKHLLVMAAPLGSSTDSDFARKMEKTISGITARFAARPGPGGKHFLIVPVGAYRAALDNENIARNDTQDAALYSTLAIAVLLILTFPRPLIGLLSMVPAFAGTMMAIFAFSLFSTSISMLAVGFGGAIISITVDHGIAYLIFLDRPHETFGRNAADEVWAAGLFTSLINVGAFLSLYFSGFSILSQIGVFSALGIFFSFLFVHTIFPLIFPVMPPAKKERRVPLQYLVNRFALSGKKYKLWGAFAFALVMLFFAKPVFHVDLASMNTISPETAAAEKLVSGVWGNIMSRVFVLVEGKTMRELQEKSDRLADVLSAETLSGSLDSAFVPSMIFPGAERKEKNFAAWRKFWNISRINATRKNIGKASREFGFSPQAFEPFFGMMSARKSPAFDTNLDNLGQFHGLLGIAVSADKKSRLLFTTLTPGKKFNSESFFKRVSGNGLGHIFDPGFFSRRLSEILSSTFIKMALIVGVTVVVLLIIFLFDWLLVLVSLLPIAFALVCTLGTLKLLERPLDIPSLMLAIVIIGMGIDYSLFFVRSYQRHRTENHPSLGLIRIAVFLSAASAVMGYGALGFSGHAMLQSAGIISLLGISYSVLGAFLILPAILPRVFSPPVLPFEEVSPGSWKHLRRAVTRYRHLEAYPRVFSFFKIKLDPMFPRLAGLLSSPKRILDIGTGYGVPGIWLLEIFHDAEFFGLEPDKERARIANRALAGRGIVTVGSAPDLPELQAKADTCLMLDMIHYLSDEDLSLTLKKVYALLGKGGTLVIRVTIPSEKKFPWERYLEKMRTRLSRVSIYFRTRGQIEKIMQEQGFKKISFEATPGREETWVTAIR